MKAVIFDFDGLILDTETALYRSWQRIYRRYGCELPLERWAANIGGYSYEVFHPIGYLEEQSGMRFDHDELNTERRAWYVDLVNSWDALPGVREMIADARALGLRVGVASSSSTRWVPGHLERLRLRGHIDAVRCGNEVEKVKPDPAVYLRVLEDLGVAAADAFAIEDSPKGLAAARAAGLYSVAVPNSVTGILDLEADQRFDSLAGVSMAELVEEIRKAVNGAL
jgi:HAD superfamily hydrolase (TIGR01509 family)